MIKSTGLTTGNDEKVFMNRLNTTEREDRETAKIIFLKTQQGWQQQ